MSAWTERAWRILAMAALLTGLCVGSPMGAEDASMPPPAEPGFVENFEPPLGVYTYVVDWGGYEAGKIYSEVTLQGDNYVVKTWAEAAGLISTFYRISFEAEEAYTAADWVPLGRSDELVTGKKRRTSEIRYQDDGTVETSKTKVKGKGQPEVKQETLSFDELTVDPFTAVSLATLVEWHEGASRVFQVFDDDERYLVRLDVVGHETLEVDGQDRPAWILAPTVKNIETPDKPVKAEDIRLYISDDEKREVLRMDTKLSFGAVQIRMERFEPAT